MSDPFFTPLSDRALVALSGEDRSDFLQGLVSADVRRADQQALFGALLTPQGKFLYDFFMVGAGDRLLLEVDRSGRDDFIQRLKKFRLRSRIQLMPEDNWQPYALWGEGSAALLAGSRPAGAALAWGEGLVFLDPRLAAAGWRAWLPTPSVLTAAGFAAAPFEVWDRHRIALGLPDGRRDIEPEKTILLEAGFDELGGVDWQKGCFMGQEVTARSKYRGQIKKRLMPVRVEGPPPAAGAPLLLGDREVGELRSQAGDLALAMVRLDALAALAEQGGQLRAGTAVVTPYRPDWARFS